MGVVSVGAERFERGILLLTTFIMIDCLHGMASFGSGDKKNPQAIA